MSEERLIHPEGVFSRFIERFRHDAAFHDLVRENTGAALAQAGIPVPQGVRVGFAPTVTQALSMTLDKSAAASAAANELEDEELLDVVGGVRAGPEDIRNFLGIFDIGRA